MLADWVAGSAFNEIAALLVLAAAIGFVGLLLRQPLIVSFIAVGIIAGPSGLDIARFSEPIDLLVELGIAVLLFLVGIKLDVNLVRYLRSAVATGLGQVGFTSVSGLLNCPVARKKRQPAVERGAYVGDAAPAPDLFP